MLKDRLSPVGGSRSSRHPAGGLPVPGQNRRRNHSRSPNNQNSNSNKWTAAAGQRTSASLPNPVIRHHQAKVRVQAGAGDKCVAPAKSKQKRRQAVPGRPIDHSTLSMDAVLWSDEVYTISQLIHAYGSKLPVITKVMEGYYTNTGLDLSVNQVVQCHSFDKQLRVRAKIDEGTGRINMPANYPIQVFYKEGGVEERCSLSEILQRRKPPLKLLVMSVDEDICVSTVDVVGRRLVITEVYQEVYMRVNTITNGWLDQEGIYAIPSCFDAKFSVAIGMRGASEAEWADYYGMFARSVRHLNFGLLSGYDGIIIEDDAGGTITLEKVKVQASGDKRVYENISALPGERRSQTLDPRPSTSQQSHVYENLVTQKQPAINRMSRNRPPSIDCVSGEMVVTGLEGASPAKKSSVDGIASTRQTGFDPPAGLPDLISTPKTVGGRIQQAEDDDVEEMFQSVLDVAAEQETLNMRSKRTEEQMLLFAKRRQEEEKRKERLRLEIQQKELERMHKSSANSPTKASQPVVTSKLSTDLAFVSSVKVEVHRESSPNRGTNPRDVRALAKQFESPGGTINDLHVGPAPPNANSAQKAAVKVTPKAVVAPNVRPPKHVSRVDIVNEQTTSPLANGLLSEDNGRPELNSSRSPRTRDGKNRRNESNAPADVSSIDDVPKDITLLTASNVCKCLVLLNMERHVPEFQRHHVDGKLLITLKETVLINDYKFTPFNASKLMRFIRGWRPKSS